jgi:uncharacterized protein YutE (UPF0331/DUF86 family)
MSPGKISSRIAAQRLEWIENMLREIESLPLADLESFLGDRRNVWAAESCLRRALEALLDLGRHVLAKGFGRGVSEYKEIATVLGELGVLGEVESRGLRVLAGYRNRMVHFYHEISEEELFEICSTRISDIRVLTDAMKGWMNRHSEMMDPSL